MRKAEMMRRGGILLCLGMLTLLCSLPLFAPGIEGRFGQDLGFHLMRIEGIARELKNGVFPVKMQSLWMDGYGYPVSVYYGDLLLYIPAMFRMLGIPVVLSYKLFVGLVNLGTAVVSFLSFRSIFGSGKSRRDLIGLVCAAAYLTAGYRFTNLYVRAAVGEYCAMMFLPLIAAAVGNIYRARERKPDAPEMPDGASDGGKQKIRDSLMLAAGLSGLIGTHLLTMEMTCVILLAVGLLFWRRTFSRRVFPVLVLAFLETVLLNLYFLVPFLDYYLHVPVYLNRTMEKTQLIQEKGADLFQMTAFWAQPFARGENSSDLSVTPGPLLLLVPVLVLMLAAFALAARFFTARGKAAKAVCDKGVPGIGKTLKFALASVVLLFLSSRYFPWDALAKSGAAGGFLAQIQFPWRYIGPAVLFLTLTLGSMLEYLAKRPETGGFVSGKKYLIKKEKKIRPGFFAAVMAAALLSCFGTVLFAVNYVRGYQPVFYEDTRDLDTYNMGMIEYLRYGTKRENFSKKPKTDTAGAMVTFAGREGATLRFYAVTEEEEADLLLPVISYPGYHVEDLAGNEYNIKDGENNVIQVTVPAGFAGTLLVYFRQPWYWQAGEILSLLVLAAALASFVLPGKGRKSSKRRGSFQ